MFSKLARVIPAFEHSVAEQLISGCDLIYQKCKKNLLYSFTSNNNLLTNWQIIALDELSLILNTLENLDDSYHSLLNNYPPFIKLHIKCMVLSAQIDKTKGRPDYFRLDSAIYLLKAAGLIFDHIKALDLNYEDIEFQHAIDFCLQELIKFQPTGITYWSPNSDFSSSVVLYGELLIKINNYCPRKMLDEEKYLDINLHQLRLDFAQKCPDGYIKLINLASSYAYIINHLTNEAEVNTFIKHYMIIFNIMKQDYIKTVNPCLNITLSYMNAHYKTYFFNFQTAYLIRSKKTLPELHPRNSVFLKEYFILMTNLIHHNILPALDLLKKINVEELIVQPLLINFFDEVILQLIAACTNVIEQLEKWHGILPGKKPSEKQYKAEIIKKRDSLLLCIQSHVNFLKKLLLTQGLILPSNSRLNDFVTKFTIEESRINDQAMVSAPDQSNKKKEKEKPKTNVKICQSSFLPKSIIKTSPAEKIIPKAICLIEPSVKNINLAIKQAQEALIQNDFSVALHYFTEAKEEAKRINNSTMEKIASEGLITTAVSRIDKPLKNCQTILITRLSTELIIDNSQQELLNKYVSTVIEQLILLHSINKYYNPIELSSSTKLTNTLIQQVNNIRTLTNNIVTLYQQLRLKKTKEHRAFLINLGKKKLDEANVTIEKGNFSYSSIDSLTAGQAEYHRQIELEQLDLFLSVLNKEDDYLDRLEDTIDTLAQTNHKLLAALDPLAKFTESVKLRLIVDEKYIFKQMQLLTGTHELILVGSRAINSLLRHYQLSLIETDDYDFIMYETAASILIEAGFKRSIGPTKELNFFQTRIANQAIDLISLTENLEQSLLSRDFTIAAIGVNNRGRVFDPSMQGIADLKERLLRTIGEAHQRIEQNPAIILRAIKYALRGFRWDIPLLKAIKNWEPNESTNYGHLKAIVKDLLKNNNETKVVNYLSQNDLLKKMFQIDAINLPDQILTLKEKVGFPIQRNSLFSHWSASQTASYKDSLSITYS